MPPDLEDLSNRILDLIGSHGNDGTTIAELLELIKASGGAIPKVDQNSADQDAVAKPLTRPSPNGSVPHIDGTSSGKVLSTLLAAHSNIIVRDNGVSDVQSMSRFDDLPLSTNLRIRTAERSSGSSEPVPVSAVPPNGNLGPCKESSVTATKGADSQPSTTTVKAPVKRGRGRPPGKAKPRIALQQVLENLEPPKPRGRPRKQKHLGVKYTSHDQLQREAGVAGIYFDIPEFENGRPGAIANQECRPVCFKSEKLKSLLWMNGENLLTTSSCSPSHVEQPVSQTPEPITLEVNTSANKPPPKLARTEEELVAFTSTADVNQLNVQNKSSGQVKIPTAKEVTTNHNIQSVTSEPSDSSTSNLSSGLSSAQMKASISLKTGNFGLQSSTYKSPYSSQATSSSYRSPYATAAIQQTSLFSSDPLSSAVRALSSQNPVPKRTRAPGSQQYRSPYSAVITNPIPRPYKSIYSSSGVRETQSSSSIAAIASSVDSNIVINNTLVADLENNEAPRNHSPVNIQTQNAPEQPKPEVLALDGEAKTPTFETHRGAHQQTDIVSGRTDFESETSRLNAQAPKSVRETSLESTLAIAQTGDLPGVEFRLAVINGDIPGNLYLSADKGSVIFSGMEATSKPPVVFPVPDIIANPTTSENGAKPMEFELTTRGEDDTEIVHIFKFLSSKTAFETANNLRAKIVTAMLLYGGSNVASRKASAAKESNDEKPFKCEKCGGMWRNMEGIKYHTTRAQVSCNPNFNPAFSQKRRGRPKGSMMNRFIHLEGYGTDGDDEGQGHDPDIIDWAPGNADRSSRFASQSNDPETWGTGQETTDKAKNIAKSKIRDTILSLLDANDGVFTGDRGLWYAIMFVLNNEQSGLHPSKTVKAALDSLVDSGTVIKVEFSFKHPGYGMITRSIVARRGIDPLSGKVIALKDKIKGTALEYYTPTEYSLPADIHNMLEGLDSTAQNLMGDRTPENIRDVGYGESGAPPNVRRSSRRVVRPVSYAVIGLDSAEAKRPVKQSNFSSNPFIRISSNPLSGAEDSESYDITTEKQAHNGNLFKSWRFASTYLPSVDGAWNRTINAPTKKAHYSQFRVPEPVTYMQTLNNPAWAFRPFGHGVRPIFARLSRTTAQSTFLGSENSFRPVLTARKRKLGPAASLKKLLTIMDDSPRISGHRKRNASDALFSDLENSRKKPKRGASKRDQTPQSTADEHQSSSIGEFTVGNGYSDKSGKNPGLDSLPRRYDFHSLLIGSPSTISSQKSTYSTVDFLAPNTYLDELSEPPEVLTENSDTIFRISESLHDNAIDALKSGCGNTSSVRFVDIKTLQGRHGRWSTKDQSFFEVESSWSLQGWFPDSKYILKQSLPTSLDEVFAHKSGTRISAQCHPSPQWAKFSSEVRAVASWEENHASLLKLGSIAPDYYFINHTIPVLECPMANNGIEAKYEFKKNNSYTLETLPYNYYKSMLEDDNSHQDIPIPPSAKRQRAMSSAASPTAATTVRNLGRPKKLDKPLRPLKSRRVTNLPEDLRGVPEDLVKELNTAEVAYDHVANEGRRRTAIETMSSADEKRLIVTITVIRTLTGGLDRTVDWVLVTKFSRFSLAHVRRQWKSLLKTHKAKIEKLALDFQAFFLEAYSRGDISLIDYDNLLGYDWERLIELAMPFLDIESARDAPGLAGSVSDIKKRYSVVEEPKKLWHDECVDPKVPIHRRVLLSTSEQSTTPVTESTQLVGIIDDFAKVRSWVRACTLTPEEMYDQKHATHMLSSFPKALVETALASLVAAKVLVAKNKGRPVPGRGFHIGEQFNTALRKHLGEQHFIAAERFKRRLDKAFRDGNPIEVEWVAEEGEILAITNMQAAGRVRLEARNVPAHKFGLKTLDGTYQSKRMDKQKLRFNMSVVPTDSYVYDKNLIVLIKMFDGQHNPPTITDGAVPVWIDINGNLMRPLWKALIAAVLGVMAMRPGMLMKDIARLMSPAMEEWETRLLIDWLVRVGALEQLAGGIEGWTTCEWWWLVAGRA